MINGNLLLGLLFLHIIFRPQAPEILSVIREKSVNKAGDQNVLPISIYHLPLMGGGADRQTDRQTDKRMEDRRLYLPIFRERLIKFQVPVLRREII